MHRQAIENEHCSIGIIDSSSVRMNAISVHSEGFDRNIKIKGLKRHPKVDSLVIIIKVVTHAANIHDSDGAKQVFEKVGSKEVEYEFN